MDIVGNEVVKTFSGVRFSWVITRVKRINGRIGWMLYRNGDQFLDLFPTLKGAVAGAKECEALYADREGA
jgi:hypothetical protein